MTSVAGTGERWTGRGPGGVLPGGGPAGVRVGVVGACRRGGDHQAGAARPRRPGCPRRCRRASRCTRSRSGCPTRRPRRPVRRRRSGAAAAAARGGGGRGERARARRGGGERGASARFCAKSGLVMGRPPSQVRDSAGTTVANYGPGGLLPALRSRVAPPILVVDHWRDLRRVACHGWPGRAARLVGWPDGRPRPRRPRALRALPPSCGPVRLIAVDGHAAPGRAPSPGRLGRRRSAARPVLHLDDLATHEELFALDGPAAEPGDRAARARRDRALRPVRLESAPLRPAARRWQPAPVVLSRGSAPGGARCARIWRGCCGWSCRREESWAAGPAAGRARTVRVLGRLDRGGDARISPTDPSRPFADTLVRQCQEGYEWLPGPAATA